MPQIPLPIPLQFAMTYVGLLIMVTSGVAMLKGQNWARLLYVGWSIIAIIIELAVSPMKAAMIPSVAFFLVIVFFLFRPQANAHFSTEGSSEDA